MQDYFAYVRVSTARQGERGVSLQEQRDAIQRHAVMHNLHITKWFEERVTAAKSGRPVFTQMLKLLRQNKARGIVIHKIDRSARNLRDWANLGELIDAGVDVRFANEALDLSTRGGRLSADIQAVVAADYIRNLREETRKGFYGRLKQGLLPSCAPLGYLDNGGGKPKTICPVKGPLICRAFELYATGSYSLDSLSSEMHHLGLRNHVGGRVSRNGWSGIFNNPFYMGIIHLRSTGESFAGVHQPLISKTLFDRVGDVLSGKAHVRQQTHAFLFRRLIACTQCGKFLIGEWQKGHVYYRCQSKTCPGTCLREESIEQAVDVSLAALSPNAQEVEYMQTLAHQMGGEWAAERRRQERTARLNVDNITSKLARLTDAFLDGAIERALFEERKTALLMERRTLEEKVDILSTDNSEPNARLAMFLELAKSAQLSGHLAKPDRKREMLQAVFSNLEVTGKIVSTERKLAFQLLADRPDFVDGTPLRDIHRTFLATLLEAIKNLEYPDSIKAHPPKNEKA